MNKPPQKPSAKSSKLANLKQTTPTNDLNIPWLTAIPDGWEMVRSKRLFSVRRERARADDEQLSATQAYGVIPQAEFERRVQRKVVRITQHLEKRAHVEPDDFVISMRSFQGGLERAWARGCIRSSYVVLKPSPEVHVGYFAHLLKSHDYIRALQATSNFIRDGQDLKFSNFCLVDLPLVPHEDQASIARFLDYANGRIERAIRAKKKLIGLLTEQKQAIIHRAVTRGLDPHVPLKPSGIPWLGDVPQHWEVRRVKQISQILRGKFTHRPRNDPSLYDGPYPFIQTGSVAQATKFIRTYKQTLNEKGMAVSKLFSRGTLVMTIAANIGDVAVLTFDACFPDSIVGFVPSTRVDRDYLYLVFRCMKPELLREAPVNTQGNLNVERIGVMGVPVPEHEEQKRIVGWVEVETNSLDIAIDRTEREISLLREYRTRLVSDVVTGQLDVREAARHLPAETVEPADRLDTTDLPDDPDLDPTASEDDA